MFTMTLSMEFVLCTRNLLLGLADNAGDNDMAASGLWADWGEVNISRRFIASSWPGSFVFVRSSRP